MLAVCQGVPVLLPLCVVLFLTPFRCFGYLFAVEPLACLVGLLKLVPVSVVFPLVLLPRLRVELLLALLVQVLLLASLQRSPRTVGL